MTRNRKCNQIFTLHSAIYHAILIGRWQHYSPFEVVVGPIDGKKLRTLSTKVKDDDILGTECLKNRESLSKVGLDNKQKIRKLMK